jgi:hypothetical protein
VKFRAVSGKSGSIFSLDLYFDRQGEPISLERWCELMEDPNYKIVEQTDVGMAHVSTVWLGLNHQYWPDGPIRIFETMIFGGHRDQEQWRYATEEAAREGHADTVESLRSDAK